MAPLRGQPFPSCVRISFEASSQCHARREVPALGTAVPCRRRRQPRVPPLRDAGQPWREESLCSSVLVFFFLLFSDLGISRRGQEEGGEEQKNRTISQRSIPNPGCLACKHPPPPTGCCGVQRKHPGVPSPYRTGHIPPSPLFKPPRCLHASGPPPQNWFCKVQQAWVQPRKGFGAAPARMPREGGTTLRQLPRGFHGILGWRDGAEPSSDAGGRASSGAMQPQLLPVTPAHKWVFLTGLRRGVLGCGSCLQSAWLPTCT